MRARRNPANCQARVASWIRAFARMTVAARGRRSVARSPETPAVRARDLIHGPMPRPGGPNAQVDRPSRSRSETFARRTPLRNPFIAELPNRLPQA